MRLEWLSAELTAMRRSAGLTQQQLAERIGSTQPSVARVEAGRVTPTLDMLERWTRATGRELVIGRARSRTRAQKSAMARRELGPGRFNPWDRDPTEVEQRRLREQGLTPEYFEKLRQSQSEDGVGL